MGAVSPARTDRPLVPRTTPHLPRTSTTASTEVPTRVRRGHVPTPVSLSFRDSARVPTQTRQSWRETDGVTYAASRPRLSVPRVHRGVSSIPGRVHPSPPVSTSSPQSYWGPKDGLQHTYPTVVPLPDVLHHLYSLRQTCVAQIAPRSGPAPRRFRPSQQSCHHPYSDPTPNRG